MATGSRAATAAQEPVSKPGAKPVATGTKTATSTAATKADQPKAEVNTPAAPPMGPVTSTFDPWPLMMNLKGKDYLPVAARIAWLRHDHPNWTITADPFVLDWEKGFACFKATIQDETGRVIATAYKTEDKRGFPDFAEKAETGSIGRACGYCGYGTVNAPDLDDGEKFGALAVKDSPVAPKHQAQAQPQAPSQQPQAPMPAKPEISPAVRAQRGLIVNLCLTVFGNTDAGKAAYREWLFMAHGLTGIGGITDMETLTAISNDLVALQDQKAEPDPFADDSPPINDNAGNGPPNPEAK